MLRKTLVIALVGLTPIMFGVDLAFAQLAATEAVPATSNQEVVVEYGNWVKVMLDPIKEAAYAAIPTIVAVVMGLLAIKMPWVSIFIPRQKVNDLVRNAVVAAIAGTEKAMEGKKLTVPVTNEIVRQAVVYMLSQAPSLLRTLGDPLTALIQKVLARLPEFADVPAEYSTDKAIKNVTLSSVVEKAKKQDVSISDQILRQLGNKPH